MAIVAALILLSLVIGAGSQMLQPPGNCCDWRRPRFRSPLAGHNARCFG